jgi:NADH/NAD ratio-sensing transcriptional regulator Rex
MVMAMLCGKTSLKSIARFARSHAQALALVIPLPRNKVPSFSTFQRLSRRLNFEQLSEGFNRWMSQYQPAETIAVDGKSITSTFKQNEEGKQSFTSLVSFFSQQSQLIGPIARLENDKCSEIEVVQKLIKALQIERSVFTLDALHCQKKRWPRLLPRVMDTSSR